AWQSQDIAPSSGISIPTADVTMANGTSDGNVAAAGSTHDGRRGSPPTRNARRSSRSRSPGRIGDDRGRASDGNSNPGNNLHVSGLAHRVDGNELESIFAKVGRVKKASVMYDPHSRESRGFGFVTMESLEEAEAAITALNSTEIHGKSITVEKARRGRARTPTPGKYCGPPKRSEFERPYDPRPYDSRYSRDYEYERRPRGGRYDDYDRRGGRDYERRRDYDKDRDRDRDRGYGRDYDRGRYDDRDRRY
ncbi:hypothetical protein AN958_11812, partial [Leucoagaricus sp. SymC.cos]